MKKNNTNSNIKNIIVIAILACLIIGYYYYLSNRNVPQPEEGVSEGEVLSEVQKVLVRDLETNYPPTPREVIKYYSEITQCFYNEELSEEEIYDLGMKARALYDAELVANQTEEDYIASLTYDIEDFKNKNRTISSYSPSSSLDVETFEQNGHEWARLYCIYGIKQGELLYNSNIVFLLRKDEESHYKIYGWELVGDEEQAGQEEADNRTN